MLTAKQLEAEKDPDRIANLLVHQRDINHKRQALLQLFPAQFKHHEDNVLVVFLDEHNGYYFRHANGVIERRPFSDHAKMYRWITGNPKFYRTTDKVRRRSVMKMVNALLEDTKDIPERNERDTAVRNRSHKRSG